MIYMLKKNYDKIQKKIQDALPSLAAAARV